MGPGSRASAAAGGILALAGLCLLAAWGTSPAGGRKASLLQEGGGRQLAVAERMERFGRELEGEGVYGAGRNLVREGRELEERARVSRAGRRQQHQARRSAGLLRRAGHARKDGWLQDKQEVVTAPYSSGAVGRGREESSGSWWSHGPQLRLQHRRQGLNEEEGVEPEREMDNTMEGDPEEEPEEAPEEPEEAEEGGGEAPGDAGGGGGGEQVASGKPGTYDGDFGEQYRRDGGGNNEAFARAGINYDDYPADVYKGIPWLTFDPAVTHTKELNQKVFEPKEVRKPYVMQSGRRAGEEVWPAGWGSWVEGTKGADKLRSAGVKVDHWPIDMVKGFPLPAWDRGEYDTDRHMPVDAPRDAQEHLEREQVAKARLQEAGVQTDGLPMGDGKQHAYNQVDGLLDTLVPQDPVPKYRKDGVARQEKPFHFLLGDHPNGETTRQADAIESVYGSGELDRRPQWRENHAEGYEYDPAEEEESYVT